MKCFKCKKRFGKVVVPSLEKKACDLCFCQIIEKRVNKVVKSLGVNQIKLRLERPSDHVLKHLLSKRWSVKIGKPNINQSTLDDIAVSVLKSFFLGRDVSIKSPAPLEGVSESELSDYARIQGIEFKGNPRIGEDKRAHDFILKLDERRPGVMYSMRDFLKNLFKQS